MPQLNRIKAIKVKVRYLELNKRFEFIIWYFLFTAKLVKNL